MDAVKKLRPGDRFQLHENEYRVAGYPESVVWQKRKTTRLAVSDAFGRTSVLVGDDLDGIQITHSIVGQSKKRSYRCITS